MKSSILHTVNQSPFTHNALAQCLAYFEEGDAILLLENGVYAALINHPLAQQLSGKTCYVMEADIQARGLIAQDRQVHIQLIDVNRFVELTAHHHLVQSWY